MRFPGIIFLGFLALTGRAGDAPADAIADAKQDLASIKAPAGQQDPSATLPTLQMRDIGAVPAANTPRLPTLSEREKEDALDPSKSKKGTGNWLVDAMEKRADSPKDGKGRDRDDLLKGDLGLAKGEEREGLMADSAREKADPKEAAASVYNPLDSFMSGWISAKDHDLLLPSSKGEGPLGSEGSRARPDPLPGLDLGASSSAVENLISQTDLASLSDSVRSAPNPYLTLLDLSPAPQIRSFAAPEGQGISLPGLSESSLGTSSSGFDARPADGNRSFIPDFAQPPDDDKYFKQMKRF
jgi:hypothetical protein